MTNTAPSYPIAGLASPANMLTVSRILASPVLFVLILEAEPSHGTTWAGFWLGWVFAASDFLDGPLARRQGTVGRTGAFLDPLADKVVVLGAAFSLVAVDRLHWFPVALVAARELTVSVMRIYYAQRGLAIPARRGAKWKTFIQGLVIAAAIAPPLEDAQGLIDALWWVAVAFTLVTGWQYLRDRELATSTTGA